MGDAVITIECLICEDKLRTSDVDDAIAFDRKHTRLHGPIPNTQEENHRVPESVGREGGSGEAT